jgi:CheY-like chemotaxis protein
MNAQKLVLVVDDDEGTSEVLRLILEHAGYLVETDRTGRLDLLKTGVLPDLILMDNKLGIRTGAEICAELKGNEQTKNIPIILISATQNLQELAEVSCADDYLAKPFDIQPLLSMVERMLMQQV